MLKKSVKKVIVVVTGIIFCLVLLMYINKDMNAKDGEDLLLKDEMEYNESEDYLEEDNVVSEENLQASEENQTEGDSNMLENEFYISDIPDDIFDKMWGKSYKEDCTIKREELSYVHILHKDFEGNTKVGELVVNKLIAQDVLEIFKELYQAEYQIEKVKLIDEYDADDEASMSDNNSSAFNFRYISYTTTISNHGKGLAIDINPLYNPYVKEVNGNISIEPSNSVDYVDREREFPHKIDKDDLCYKLFIEHGFEWGGDWSSAKDYQHFEISQSKLEELSKQ